jgi:hypothetical protein
MTRITIKIYFPATQLFPVPTCFSHDAPGGGILMATSFRVRAYKNWYGLQFAMNAYALKLPSWITLANLLETIVFLQF